MMERRPSTRNPSQRLHGFASVSEKRVPKGAWHSIEVHEPSTIFEGKDGAYGK